MLAVGFPGLLGLLDGQLLGGPARAAEGDEGRGDREPGALALGRVGLAAGRQPD